MNMQEHFKLSDSDFKNQLVSCTLDPILFTHEAHIRLAWINIKENGIEKADELIQKQIIDFVEFVGARDKYNKTVTIAAMKVVYHFILKSKADNFMSFINEFPRLNNNFKELLGSHYSFDIFKSDDARNNYLEPDLMPFD